MRPSIKQAGRVMRRGVAASILLVVAVFIGLATFGLLGMLWLIVTGEVRLSIGQP